MANVTTTKNAHVKSILFCKDGNFKRRITSLLLDAAFPSEKFGCSTIREARDKFCVEHRVGVIIVNGVDFPGGSVFQILTELAPTFAERECKIIVYLSDEQFEMVEGVREKFKKYHFFQGDMNKAQINSVLNPIATKSFHQKVEAAAKPAAPKKNMSFMEASAHVKDTVDMIKAVAGNRSDLASVTNIGQRFNGIIGTFAFIKGKDGYKQLSDLSGVIDDLCRHYEKGDFPEISQPHFDLLLNAAKCCYMMLKDLRDQKPVADDQNKQYENVMQIFAGAKEIERRQSQSQDEVDALLDQLEGDKDSA